MNTHRNFLLAAAASVIMACGPAMAVTQIEDTQIYTYQNGISPSGSHLGVVFVARATAMDIASGVTFSIQERDPDGNDVLFDVALPWEPPYPAVGTELRVTAGCQIRCENNSLVAQYVGQWFVTWCDLDLGTQVRYGGSGITRSTGTSEPESFEFVLADENGIEAPGATAEDAYYCAPYAVSKSEPLFTSPYDLVRQGSSITSESGIIPRGRVTSEDAGTIQIAFDPAGEVVCGEIPPWTPTTLYVVARRAGPTRCGITGAELRIVGIPEGWLTTITTPPSSGSVGDPLREPGGNIAFMDCQMPASGPVVLYTISVLATSAVTDQVVHVLARNPSTNPYFDCPLVTMCDFPMYSMTCVGGSQLHINPPAGAECEKTLGVQAGTWTTVKGLYR